ncbi:hypothetical protein [Methanococcoides sp. LMO-2]|uniref:S-layer protein n=1 Tax=Methanococcoides cohabitans TaxID=3136559 RepID=A0ABU9KRX9_9EURY
MKIYKRSVGILIALMLLLVAAVPMQASAATSSSSTLRVDLLKYDPYPAEIGSYVDVWIKVENFASGSTEDVSIKMEPEYPFSLDSEKNAIKNFGILPPDRAAIHEYRLYVDEGARAGTGSFDILYRAGDDFTWQKETFEIKVGSTTFDSKGTVALSNVISSPEVLMPGDDGSISFTLTNTAQQSTITIDGESYDTYARVQSATLVGTDMITVTSPPYEGKGVLGPGDFVQVTYNMEISDSIEDGTYFLDLVMIGNSHSFNNNWMVPVVVDSSAVRVIPSVPLVLKNGQADLEFDVANIHPNELSSVLVKMEADGVEFLPQEYFVGSMDPDELFTIEIEAQADDPKATGEVNLTIYTEYRNGLNEHEESLGERVLKLEQVKEDNDSNAIVILLLGAIIVGTAYYMYRKKGLRISMES